MAFDEDLPAYMWEVLRGVWVYVMVIIKTGCKTEKLPPGKQFCARQAQITRLTDLTWPPAGGGGVANSPFWLLSEYSGRKFDSSENFSSFGMRTE